MASAGSGKTFQLSNRYIQLILNGAAPGSILASTFTRLAAGEIRDRILQRLASAVESSDERKALAKALGYEHLSRGEALDATVTVTRNLHRLLVRTLDSFFSQIVRCFALELGIDPAASIVDPDTEIQMRREAIELMLDERDPQSLIDLLRVLSEGGASESRRVTEAIDDEMRSLYELYREAPPQAWEWIGMLKPLPLDAVRSATETLRTCPPSGNGHHIRAHDSDCRRAAAARPNNADDWLSFLGSGLACAIAYRAGVFHNKPIEPSVERLYLPLIDHAKAVIRNAIASRTCSTRELLSRFHTCYEGVKFRHKASTFADITTKLAEGLSPTHQEGEGIPAVQGHPVSAEDICFRLDAVLRHLLLDEMQDTSVQQWRALSEIVRNIISEPPPARSFFCVGDVKQSIYGWREACPEVLAQMPALLRDLGGIAEATTLPQNWRSSPVILEAVDRVFIDTRPYSALDSLPHAIHEWAGRYEPHVPMRDTPGYAELRTACLADRAAGQNQSLVRMSDAADLIGDLCRQSPQRTIGVLTRTNESVSCLLYELGPAGHGLDVAGRGGGSLTDSAPVNAVLDLLRLADHPDHTVAAFNVIHSPLGQSFGFTKLSQRNEVARNVRRSLLNDGYAKTIGDWIARIGKHCDGRELRRLVQLQQLAADFHRRATLRTDDFVAFVEVAAVSDVGGSIDGRAPQVQVMTIHQAKGLEFDIVVLPDLDQSIVRTSNMKLVAERDSYGNISRVARHVSKEAWALFEDLAPMYDQQIVRMARDSLCSLYVAMTRARHALHMIINPSSQRERSIPKTLAGVLRGAFTEAQPAPPESLLFQLGDPHWCGLAPKSPLPAETTPDSRAMRIELAPPSNDVPKGRAPMSATEYESDSLDHEHSSSGHNRLLRSCDRMARDRGTAIHLLFEEIEWLADFAPDHEKLERLALTAAPRRGVEWAREQVKAFLGMLKQPEICDALSRTTHELRSVVRREVPFALRVDGRVHTGIIDRMVTHLDDAGRCKGAVVLDYKTDVVDLDGLFERAESYRPQLDAYRAATEDLLKVDQSLIVTKLLFVTLGRVVEF